MVGVVKPTVDDEERLAALKREGAAVVARRERLAAQEFAIKQNGAAPKPAVVEEGARVEDGAAAHDRPDAAAAAAHEHSEHGEGVEEVRTAPRDQERVGEVVMTKLTDEELLIQQVRVMQRVVHALAASEVWGMMNGRWD